MMAGIEILPSTRSLEADLYTKSFGASATPTHPGSAYSDYGFIAVLGLAQRLKIDLLPITWQAPLGLIGQSRARINQALLNIQTSFAFKRFNHTDQSDPFREAVQEMAILSHPLVQNHPHIVQLIGICWDIPQDDQVWPVLVFEKTHLGDLYHFAQFGKGKGLSVKDKLKICVDVGIAIQDMHLNNIVHGDVKPQNVLIFEESPGVYTAKVADFGLSTHFRGEKDLINMPISVPWNAPDHHDRAFYPQDAKAIDVYSFGMLCLWLLFGVETSKATPCPSEAANVAEIFSFKAKDWSEKGDLLLSWKRDRLLEWATWLATKDGRLSIEVKDRVSRFLRSSICVNPQTRITDWSSLLSFLDPAREIISTAILSEIMVPKEEYFQIAASIPSLYLADFRLRYFIVTNLKAIAPKSSTSVFEHTSIANASQELAFCYRIGFGVPKREDIRKEFYISPSQNSALEKQIQLIRDGMTQLFSIEGRMHQFNEQGFVQFIDFQYYSEKGLTSRAEHVLRKEIQDTKYVFGENHWLNLVLRTQLASTYRNQGRWEVAEVLDVEIMEIRKKKLGADHPDTLTSTANLALTYSKQGRWKDAEALEMKVMEMSQKKLGIDHPDTLTSMANLASTYRNRGRWEDAEALLVEVVETSKEKIGADHPSTLTSMTKLASTYRDQGRWEAAETLDVEVVETSKKKLGADHPSTLTSMNNLASTNRDQGRWEIAESLYTEVMETCKKKLGADHPDTLASMGNLASTYSNQGRWKDAEALEVEVMDISKKKLGVDHPNTLTAIANLASMYRNQSRWEAAEALDVEVVETSKKKLGADHPSTLTSITNLASTYRNRGRWEGAEALLMEVIEPGKKKLGVDHPLMLASMANLASTHWNQGRWEAAEALLVEVVEMSRRKLGANHPDTLTGMASLASTYRKQGRWKAAEALDVEVMEARKKKLGADHPDTLTSMANLASTYWSQGQWKAAEALFVKVMDTRRTKLGANHHSTLTCMANLALTYKDQGRWEDAEALLVEVIETGKKKLGVDHSLTLASMANLASTHWNQGRWEAAEAMLVEVIETSKRLLGTDHPDTLTSIANLVLMWKEQGRDAEAIKLMSEYV